MPRKGTYARLYKRPLITGACAHCGAPITGTRAKRYCSAGCRVRGWRVRREGDASSGPQRRG